MQGRNLSTLHLSFFESRLFSLPNHIPLHQGVSYFCRTASSNVSGLKTKTLEALQLQGFVLVDDTGLEPVTSRTSSGRRYFFALESLDLPGQMIFGIV